MKLMSIAHSVHAVPKSSNFHKSYLLGALSMSNPVLRKMGTGFTVVSAWGAAPFIKQALLLDADIAVINTSKNNVVRMLSHGAEGRALTSMPWPLSLVQPHNVSYTTTTADGRHLPGEDYERSRIDEAIRRFLSEIGSDDEVSIAVN